MLGLLATWPLISYASKSIVFPSFFVIGIVFYRHKTDMNEINFFANER